MSGPSAAWLHAHAPLVSHWRRGAVCRHPRLAKPHSASLQAQRVASWRARHTYWQPGCTYWLPCLAAAAASAVASRPPQTSDGDEEYERPVDDIEAESLAALDWPDLCAQVASFASTPMATEIILGDGLPIGETLTESETLLQQTEQAAETDLKFDRAFDLRGLLEAVQKGRSLHTRHLNGVATTMKAAFRLAEAVKGKTALEPLMPPLDEGLSSLVDAINFCIDEDGAYVLDRADPRLGVAREARHVNRKELETNLRQWVLKLRQLGASDASQPSMMRMRSCVTVKRGRQHELPKGSVKLGTSTTGKTLYMEPLPVVDLNNTAVRLDSELQALENAVLLKLCKETAKQAGAIRAALRGITALDVVAARVGHAKWCKGLRPCFLGAQQAAAEGPVRVSAMRHPLLLQRCLEPLPRTVTPGDAAFEEGFGEPLKTVADFGDSPYSTSSDSSDSEDISPPAKKPCPVDLVVPPQASVVMVTGPNTGGKTASLKALGLAVLMAKAGLFLPLVPGSPQPSLLWFDKVLADVGDGQSLQQSLSTFSAHVRRLRLMLDAVTPSTLALLDEVGSGTDPAEGEALAAALLQRLADTTRLTFATTHHAGLKDMKDPRFVNASVEFDLATLRPTYRLLWGEAGQSNALAIAEGLGFSPAVVKAAREVADTMWEITSQHARGSEMAAELDDQAREAQAASVRAKKARAAAEEAVQEARKQLVVLRHEKQAAAATDERPPLVIKAAEARKELENMVTEVGSGLYSASDALTRIGQLEKVLSDSVPEMSREALASFKPAVGQQVMVRSMGMRLPVQAIMPSGEVVVGTGSMQMVFSPADIAPADGSTIQGGQRGQQSSGAGSTAARKEARQRLSDERMRRRYPEEGEGAAPVAVEDARIQTEANTVDLRGQTVDDAMDALDRAIASCPQGLALAIIHGRGTGRVRQAVHDKLRASKEVKSFEMDDKSFGGMTWAIIKFSLMDF